MLDSVSLFNIGLAFYILAALFYVIYAFTRKEGVGKVASILALIGVIIQGAGFIVRGFHKAQVNEVTSILELYKYAPFTNMYESLMLFGWMVVLIYLFFERRYKNKMFGMFVLPLAILAESSTSILGFTGEVQPLIPALQSNWLLFHVVTCFIGYAGAAVAAGIAFAYFLKREDTTKADWFIMWFTLAFGAFWALLSIYRLSAWFSCLVLSIVIASVITGILWIIKKVGIPKYFPNAEQLENIMYYSVAVGFVFLTIGIITGAVWAKYAWGGYWSWDPKETWSLITWLIYAAYLHVKYIKGWAGKKLAYFSLLGFISVIFTYYGVNLLLPGLHSYA
jgi:cytochrome c-type biogenesis protein CcsB